MCDWSWTENGIHRDSEPSLAETIRGAVETFGASAHERRFVCSTAMETANACSPGPVLKSEPITRSVMHWIVGHGNSPCFRIAKNC